MSPDRFSDHRRPTKTAVEPLFSRIAEDLTDDQPDRRLAAAERLATLLLLPGGPPNLLRERIRKELIKVRDHDDSKRVSAAAAEALKGFRVPHRGVPKWLMAALVMIVLIGTLVAVNYVPNAGASPYTPPPTSSVVAAPDRTLVVGVDLPFHGPSAEISEHTLFAMNLYLEQQDHKAGKYKVELKKYDNSTEESNKWDEDQCIKNAEDHVSNSNEVAVMGPTNSPCAKLIAPVLNRAPGGPMLMVSHANTEIGLTKPEERKEPEKYFPTGKRSYARVVATNDELGVTAAQFAFRELGARKIFVLDDNETYGRGVAESFKEEIVKQGAEVVDTASWGRHHYSYRTLFNGIKTGHPDVDAIFLGGIFDNNGERLIKDKVAALGDNDKVKLIAPSGFVRPDFLDMNESLGAYLVFPGLSTTYFKEEDTHGTARRFIDDFNQKYGFEPRSWYPMYGVQALQFILAAIAKSDGTRKGVRDAVFEGAGVTIEGSQAIIGKTISIDTTSGDASTKDVTVVRVKEYGGKLYEAAVPFKALES